MLPHDRARWVLAIDLVSGPFSAPLPSYPEIAPWGTLRTAYRVVLGLWNHVAAKEHMPLCHSTTTHTVLNRCGKGPLARPYIRSTTIVILIFGTRLIGWASSLDRDATPCARVTMECHPTGMLEQSGHDRTVRETRDAITANGRGDYVPDLCLGRVEGWSMA